MNLKELKESNCQQFTYSQRNREIGTYKPPVIVSKQEVIDAVCKSALVVTQREGYYKDSEILNAIEYTISEYSEYKLTEDTITRLSELTGFKQENWSHLLKA